MNLPLVSVSVVSHAQVQLVAALLADLQKYCQATSLEVVLTHNLAEPLTLATDNFRFPVKVLHNAHPQGFGANHNQAFEHSRGAFFCVVNPDIRLQHDPFPALLACLTEADVGVAAPCVRNPAGQIEDSARRFPTPWGILRKAWGLRDPSVIHIADMPTNVDWAAGMFLLVPRAVYTQLGGFDARYFLYYEDVDFCARLANRGLRTVVTPWATVCHDARRSSHTQWRYLVWHLRSMLRFFAGRVWRRWPWAAAKVH